jgi:hypothetical protein
MDFVELVAKLRRLAGAIKRIPVQGVQDRGEAILFPGSEIEGRLEASPAPPGM